MTALTNEIIGLAVLVTVIVLALALRHLLVASRRDGDRATAAREPVDPTSGPVPVWAGTALPPKPAFGAGAGVTVGDEQPPQVLPSVSSRPEPAPRPVLPPPVVVPAPSKQSRDPAFAAMVPGDTDPLGDPEVLGDTAVLGPETTRDGLDLPQSPSAEPAGSGEPTCSAGEASPAPRSRSQESEQQHIVAVPGNSAHASRVMHVSSVRSELASELPTDWLVVTPVDLLGKLPNRPETPRPAYVPPPPDAPPASDAPPAPDAPFPTGDERQAIHLEPRPPTAPNPFAATSNESVTTEFGMPSRLLSDLLDAE